ncbi:MAG: hypothetical protein PGN37_11290 [Mycobacterium kyogaense]|uniref:hypothetical protein n=1 Tax=Mycobacterium kyogaense TaxID=2212479 RepID=UPI002FF47011
MTDDLVDQISRLPAIPGITYRGMIGAPPRYAITLSGLLPTSVNPRVASENFTSERVAAIATTSGRYIAPLSRHPDEMEVVLLPGTLLLPVGFVEVGRLENPVVLLEEPGSAPGLPANRIELQELVEQQIEAALASPPVSVHSPGRFTPRNP